MNVIHCGWVKKHVSKPKVNDVAVHSTNKCHLPVEIVSFPHVEDFRVYVLEKFGHSSFCLTEFLLGLLGLLACGLNVFVLERQ